MGHKTAFPRRAAAFFLALLLAVPPVFADAGEQKLQTTTQIVDGLTYYNTVTSNGGSRVESFALELSPGSSARPILLQGDETIYGAGNINNAVTSAQNRGYRVLGAINTDFFAMQTGVPVGIVVEDGVFKSDTKDENVLAFNNGQTAVLDLPQVSISLQNQGTGYSVSPQYFNKYRNEIGGVYCHANPWLLRDLLRGEFGFEGLVVSDGVAIDQLDAVTGDRLASGALALEAGVDLGLWDTAFGRLEEAAARGLTSEARIDEAAGRVLELKFRRGLFEEPFIPESSCWQGYTPESHPQAKRLAEESMTLLKNAGNLLPLDGRKPLRILLTGPGADDLYGQLGDYTPPVRPEAGVTFRQGLERWLERGGSPAALTFRAGCRRFAPSPELLAQAEWAAREADVIVAVLGGSSSRFSGGTFQDNGALADQETASMDCGENVDAALLRLPGDQLELLRRLRGTGKPVVTFLIQGRPYEMEEIDACSDALFCCFYPGLTGGEAAAKLLFGDLAPAVLLLYPGRRRPSGGPAGPGGTAAGVLQL